MVDLPEFSGHTEYNFISYSGCILREPTAEEYFAGYSKNVSMLVLTAKAV